MGSVPDDVVQAPLLILNRRNLQRPLITSIINTRYALHPNALQNIAANFPL